MFNNQSKYGYRDLAIKRGKAVARNNTVSNLIYEVLAGTMLAVFLVSYILY